MSKSPVAADVSIEQRAESLGVELTPEALSSKEARENTETALTELSSASLTAPEYLTKMQEIANGASKALAELAKASGSIEAADLVSQFDEQIKGGVTSLAEGLMGKINESGKFGPDFEKLCSGTQGILESCMNLGKSTDDKDEKSEEEKKRNAEMRKLMIIAAAVIAALFIGYFGVPLELVLLASVAFKAYSESKEKSPVKLCKDFADKIVNDESYRDKAFEKALEVASIACPGLSVLGLAGAASGITTAITGTKAANELFSKSKAMLASIPRSPAQMEKEVFAGLDKVIERTLEEKPELRDKLKDLLEKVKTREASEIFSSLGDLAKKGFDERGIAGKAQDMISGAQSVNDLVAKFTKLVSSELTLTQPEKVFVEKVVKEMKQYVSEKYAKPVQQFCEAASKAGAGELATRLGLSKTVIERVTLAVAQLRQSEPSVGRSR